ncbi:phage major capsid protein [Qipengyuania flava]|uniref:phage major capsid protein n=1 Tax=Qipengyuania flava TaxID=192812 RepID=UPI001F3A8D0C|nr:phage major capsid protein [Qipengyuania flava]
MLGDGFLDWLREQDDRTKTGLIAQLEERERALIRHDWPLWRREAQSPPRGAWNCWVICAGRGFGKTRTGAEWVRECAILDPDARIALVAASLGEARSVMVEGESGVLESCRHEGPSDTLCRVVVGVDPPASDRGDECGIVVCALGASGIAQVIDLVHALKAGHRQGASFVMNSATLAEVRKLRSEDGAFLWQPGLVEGQPDRLLGYRFGRLRWIDGPLTGIAHSIVDAQENTVTLADPLLPEVQPGRRVLLREGCDRTLATCADRFGNALNFRGEPFLPGNDMMARYPVPR